jgi:hypothetical protein
MPARLLGALVVAAVLSGLPATALATTPKKGVYAGRSTQTQVPSNVVRLRVDRHHEVAHFAIDWSATCGKPNTFWDAGTQIDDPKNGPTGTFHRHGSYRSKTNDGYTGRVTVTVDGHFTDRTHAAGDWKATVKVSDPGGERVDTCSVKTQWRVGPA